MRLTRTRTAKPAITLALNRIQFTVWRSGEWEMHWAWRGEVHVRSGPRVGRMYRAAELG